MKSTSWSNVGHLIIYALIKSDPGFREEPNDELNNNSPKPFWSGNESHVSYAQAAQHSVISLRYNSSLHS